MKKVLSIMLALVMCLGLFACGKSQTNEISMDQTNEMPPEQPSEDEIKANKDEIELTLDNYSMYLTVSGSVWPMSTESKIGDFRLSSPISIGNRSYTMVTLYKNIKLNCETEAASTNYDYNNVEITVNFKGTYGKMNTSTAKWTDVDFDETFTVKLNIGGNGSDSLVVPIEGYTFDDITNIEMEVVGVSGSVSKN